MAGINKVILVGNLGIDPEVRTLESGVKVARLRIATTEVYIKDGNRMEQTEWHTVNCWRQLAEVCEKYLSKGKQVYIEGKLRTRSWKDADGNDKYSTEITADTLQMLGPKPSGDQAAEPKQEAANAAHQMAGSSASADEDDLPF